MKNKKKQVQKNCFFTSQCIRHNYVGSKDGYNFDDVLTIKGAVAFDHDMTSLGSRDALHVREKFADNFKFRRSWALAV